MNTVEAHCVPIALVATAACVLWLQRTRWLKAASVDVAMTQLLGTDEVERGIPAVFIAFSHRYPTEGSSRRNQPLMTDPGGCGMPRYTPLQLKATAVVGWVVVRGRNTGRRRVKGTTTTTSTGGQPFVEDAARCAPTTSRGAHNEGPAAVKPSIGS